MAWPKPPEGRSVPGRGRQRTEKPDERGRLLLQAKVPREIVFKTKDLAHAHGITIEATVTWALRSLLTRAGVRIRPDGVNDATGKVLE